MTIKQNLQVVKPRAKQTYEGPNGEIFRPPLWVVTGNGHAQYGPNLDTAYKRWVEEYIYRALHGHPGDLPKPQQG